MGLCGNPNVGKSTLFNRLTGLRQHTGNWPGKTVGSAVGRWGSVELVDTPGSYSLAAHSAEEEVTRDFILFGPAEKLILVADATNLRRSLVLLLQTLEIRGDVVLCVNLMDEAERRGIRVDTAKLSSELGIPVLPMNAAAGEGIAALEEALRLPDGRPASVSLPSGAEELLAPLAAYLEGLPLPAMWLAGTMVSGEEGVCTALAQQLCLDPLRDMELARLIEKSRTALADAGWDKTKLEDHHAQMLALCAEKLCSKAVSVRENMSRPLRLDRALTHPLWGTTIMLGFLSVLLWITMRLSNVPSEYLSRWLFSLGEAFRETFVTWGLPPRLIAALCDGVWRTTAWVTAVMLPPMAIFFPLFTLLEDLGYLPRVAFNLDGALQSCGACGKQGLCMLMGLGCNAVGVTGSRIIDSPRERLLSQLTNAFIPCNGRFPLLIALLSVFFGSMGSLLPALALAALISLSVMLSCLTSKILSMTLLKGTASSFVLELPPYRKPQWATVLLRSLLDRTLFVLGRAVSVAAPAGLIIWCLANTEVQGQSLLQGARSFLEGAGQLLCMDGAILLGFLLALPANEIALPAMLLIYSGGRALQEYGGLVELQSVLRAQGWDGFTAAAVMLFTVFHWPCATTLLTIRKESGSIFWMIFGAVLPTLWGVTLCAMLAIVRRFLVA